MPPKTKGKDDKKKEEQPQEDGSERELVEKELVIGYLKSKLGRYQDNGERLQVENIRLNDELETQKLNLRDINEFLTNELKARSLTTSALEAKVFELNQLLDEIRKNHEDALGKLRRDKDRDIESLQTQIKEYEKKNKTTLEFLDRKDQLEAELANLKETLNKKIKEYEQKLTDMDRQHIQDREKWKRETAQKIKETKIQMMKLTDNQLEMTTKRTIMENEQMSIELAYQSRQTEKLLAKNAVLVEENGDLRRQLELSKQTEEELAKRNNVYQKTIKSLLTKLKEQGQAQEESSGLVTALEGRISDLESQLHLAELQTDELQHQLGQVKSRLSDKSTELDTWNARYGQAVQFLMRCLEDVREKIVTVVRSEDVGGPSGLGGYGGYGDSYGAEESPGADISVLPGRLEDLSWDQRERVLAYLLEKLHVFQRSQQLEAAVAAGTSPPSASGGARSSAGENNPVTLPPIPAFPRRNPTATTPISQTMVAASSSWATVPAAPQAPDLAASWPAPSGSMAVAGRSYSGVMKGLSVVPEQGPAGPLGTTSLLGPAEPPQPLPAVDDLLSKVMSDVRPWGKRSQELPLSTSKTGVFLKKGPPGKVAAR
mmetsp:Transcript_5179/g.11289  ORF Transcript_5179/g.11289 Transcript_5179/m.11289 type:complete len:601 (-) Transcript_5179:161-1963(-)|eukprot:CAMPEP_0202901746 /NCGR_PEP_ID=MMETSP1392-20130828/14431_1 /ASSEMBLY_ACC=CAM_ASM_000868 /TAXON_ID=225041 /ORGANISM="Chlamydomonas chlamydogama, Strain SAG 11-48b" /LENGTH=600 /DNA_ID=CAMNT_0049588355 /DNA_START=228 /DNA_END=2030 /DNA_ORIENTATION=+